MGKIIALANQKGGVGKTTTTINLGAALADREYKVLLVDMDPQGNTTSGVGAELDDNRPSVYEMLIGSATAKDAIIKNVNGGMDILPTRIDLTAAEIELVPIEKREALLKKQLESIRNDYDFIFVDCPPSLGLLTVNALTGADSVLIPLQCEYYALEGMGQLMNTIRLIREGLNKGLVLEGILLTMYDRRNRLSQEVMRQAMKFFPKDVFRTVIPRNVRLSEAPSYGQPINLYDKNSVGATSYSELADELVERNLSAGVES